MSKTLKVFGFTFAGILIVLATYIGLLFYPTIWFANHAEYGNLSVHSDTDFGDEICPILRDIEVALETSEIYDPALKHDIIFGYDNSTFAAIQEYRDGRGVGMANLLLHIPCALGIPSRCEGTEF